MPVDLSAALTDSIQSVTRDWTKAKRQADRQSRVTERELERLRRARSAQQLNVKQAAYSVMEAAYQQVRGPRGLPANARQIMYAARPHVLRLTGGKCWKESSYFTQHLLPDYMAEHAASTADWDVVFDDRGHLVEPHTEQELGVGSLEVRRYVHRWTERVEAGIDAERLVDGVRRVPTVGPAHRYSAVVFVEKEGFNELFARVRLADRFDLAIMSSKGMSVTAARELVEQLSIKGVTVCVLRDFDKAGFSIVHTLRSSTRRYAFTARPRVVDLGLRLDDVRAMGLESEPVEYDGRIDPRINLRRSGASPEECDFLVRGGTRAGRWVGERVELNAMDSRQLVTWLEGKLTAAGVGKLVPEPDVLAAAYRRAARLAAVRRVLERATRDEADIIVPEHLAERVAEAIAGTAEPWDAAVWDLAQAAVAEGEESG